jgi:general secretion pathway protein C
MQNFKYHLLNLGSVLLFSYTSAASISDLSKNIFAPASDVKGPKQAKAPVQEKQKTYEDYKAVILDQTRFFRIAKVSAETKEGPKSAPTDIQLLGTIVGPPSFSRALMKKKTDKESLIYRIGNDVFGYKLIRIDNTKAHLKTGNDVVIIDMNEDKNDKKGTGPGSLGSGPDKVKQNISRSEIQQKVLNNVDNALAGIRAGPYRVNNKIEGYKLFSVSPDNILFRMGARSGDIIKRINGHPLDSTEKLYKMWQSVQGDTKITIDLERGGKLISNEINITD